MTAFDLRVRVADEYGAAARERVGFFTDTSLCIGCKACEVACKEWNHVPADSDGTVSGQSMDNTGALGANTWRHVAFIEQPAATPVLPAPHPDSGRTPMDDAIEARPDFRWLMSSDVCKHCTEAACLEACPTGALLRTEFGTVVVQEDVCNGCGYCVPVCPFGVLDRRHSDGIVHKCTLCYDRLKDDRTPACAKACPTQSIQFGPLEQLREHARDRVEELRGQGEDSAQLYLADEDNGIGGAGAFFLLLDEPEVYGLPPDPRSVTRDLPALWRTTALAGGTILAGAFAALLGGRR